MNAILKFGQTLPGRILFILAALILTLTALRDLVSTVPQPATVPTATRTVTPMGGNTVRDTATPTVSVTPAPTETTFIVPVTGATQTPTLKVEGNKVWVTPNEYVVFDKGFLEGPTLSPSNRQFVVLKDNNVVDVYDLVKHQIVQRIERVSSLASCYWGEKEILTCQ